LYTTPITRLPAAVVVTDFDGRVALVWGSVAVAPFWVVAAPVNTMGRMRLSGFAVAPLFWVKFAVTVMLVCAEGHEAYHTSQLPPTLPVENVFDRAPVMSAHVR